MITVTEIAYSAESERAEGAAAAAILEIYEEAMRAAIVAEYPGAEYTLDVRDHVTGHGTGIWVHNEEGAEDSKAQAQVEQLRVTLSYRCSQEYWAAHDLSPADHR